MSENSFDNANIHADGDIHIGDDITNVTYDVNSFEQAEHRNQYFAEKASQARELISYYYHLLRLDFVGLLLAVYLLAFFVVYRFYDSSPEGYLVLFMLPALILEIPCSLICGALLFWLVDDLTALFQQKYHVLIVGVFMLVIFGIRMKIHFKKASDYCDVEDFCEDKEKQALDEMLR